jgi:hypothetical protein
MVQGTEWLTRHNNENHIISSGSHRCMKQVTYFLPTTLTAELTVKYPKSHVYSVRNGNGLFLVEGSIG